MTYRQLLACVSVDGVGSTQIMSITVTNEDPALAGKIVQAIAETAPDVIVDKVEAGSCKVVSDVEITSNPVFPQTKKYVLTAALGGIVAACGILVLDHLLHDYIVDSEDIQKKLERPVLGLIPEVYYHEESVQPKHHLQLFGKQAFASAHHPEGYAVCLR